MRLTLDELASRFEAVRRSGEGFVARCPTHEDRTPSLSLGNGERGLVVKCFAGCATRDVVAAVGLAESDLFYEGTSVNGAGLGEPAEIYDYVAAGGEPLFQVVRFEPKTFRQRRPDGHGGWTWNLTGVARVLYRLPAVVAAVAAGETVYVVEGEKDVHAAERAGAVATTNPGGAGKWRAEHSEALRGARVVVVADKDEPGERHARNVARELTGVAATAALVTPMEGNDLAEHLAAGFDLDMLEPLFDEPQSPPHEDPTVALADFVARRDENAPAALLACEQGTVLPPGGLGLLVGKAGGGKSTQAVDLCLHAGSGLDYVGLTFPRPLRVLFVQNEGPREAFRDKLETRLERWPHDTQPIRVWDEPSRWGQVKLSDNAQRDRFRQVVEQHAIDLVVSDSLTRFGMQGNGTPEETRDFMAWLAEAGLGRTVAFLLLHHPRSRSDPTEEELEQIAGAWSPHADAILMLKKLDGNRARLSFPKLRWARGTRPASILAFDPEAEAFTFITDETDTDPVDAETYEQRILDYLDEHPWATTTELDDDVEGRASEVRAARKRLETAGRVKTHTSAELGRVGRFTHWNTSDPATETSFHPSQLPGTGQDEEASHPSDPSHPSALKEGTGGRDGSNLTPNDEDELARLSHLQRELGL